MCNLFPGMCLDLKSIYSEEVNGDQSKGNRQEAEGK